MTKDKLTEETDPKSSISINNTSEDSDYEKNGSKSPSTEIANSDEEIEGQKAKKLNLSMSKEDFSELEDYIEHDKINDFIKEYQVKHPELSTVDIDSLALMGVIKENKVFSDNPILKILYLEDDISPDLIVTLDENGKNAILYALENNTCILTLDEYIFTLDRENKITEKFILDDDLAQKFAYVIKHCYYETHPTEFIKNLIEPLYTEKSVNHLIEIIGQEWLDNYYI